MNMLNMMQNVQKMQKRLQDAQKELADTEVVAYSNGEAVEVKFSGQAKFKSIKIKPEAINPENPQDVDVDMLEMLEDLITEAMKNANDKATKQMESKMKTITGGISIPGLF